MNPLIKEALSHSDWADGSNPHDTGRTTTEEAFDKTRASLKQLSFGDRDSRTTLTNTRNITIFNPKDQTSKTKAYCDIQLALLVRDGFNLAYTDGSGRESHNAAGLHHSGTSKGEYLGTQHIQRRRNPSHRPSTGRPASQTRL